MSLSITSAIASVDKKLGEIIHEDLPILKEIKSYVIASGGKRIRPLLTFFLYQILGGKGKVWLIPAAVSELIHSASLLHDDVVDQADTRRGRPTVAHRFGNKTAILSGDYLLACGIQALNDLQNQELMDLYSQVLRDLSVSELLQMEYECNPKITKDIYNRIIHGKTSSLFGACAVSAGILLAKPTKEKKELHKFGIQLGNFFQQNDDCLDYFTDSNSSGKVFLKDFRNGLYTYPILVLKQLIPPKTQKKVDQLLSNNPKNDSDDQVILDLMEEFEVKKFLIQDQNSKRQELQNYVKRLGNTSSTKLLLEQLSTVGLR